MHVARRPLSIGEHALAPGDVITDEIADRLPAGRLNQLVSGGWIEERTDGNIALLSAAVEELFARVEALEARGGPRAKRAAAPEED